MRLGALIEPTPSRAAPVCWGASERKPGRRLSHSAIRQGSRREQDRITRSDLAAAGGGKRLGSIAILRLWERTPKKCSPS